MVNRFHRQLKAALCASSSPEHWSEMLPMFFLDRRSAIKSDLGYSASKLLYGTSLVLPGTTFTPVNNDSRDFSSYVARLRSYFTKLAPMATRHQTTSTHVPRDMDSWTRVFVRNDMVCGPFNSPYLGPFKVLSQAKKYFKLDMNGRTESVSVTRLKKARFECDITDFTVALDYTYNFLFVSILN